MSSKQIPYGPDNPTDPTQPGEFQLLKRYSKVPATAYLSRAGVDYYQPGHRPRAEKVTLDIELRGFILESDTEPTSVALKVLRYTSSKGVTGFFALHGSQDGFPFLGHQVLLFRYIRDSNPDPDPDGVDVHRTLALGVRPRRRPHDGIPWGDFIFLREIDSFGNGHPPANDQPEDFQIFTSPIAYPASGPDGGFLFKDLIVEAGTTAGG